MEHGGYVYSLAAVGYKSDMDSFHGEKALLAARALPASGDAEAIPLEICTSWRRF